MIPRSSLAIIGYGQFGRFLHAHLRRRFRVVVHDPAAGEAMARDGVRAVELAEAARCRVVVLAVPVQDLERLAREIGPLLGTGFGTGVGAGTVVVDVASVKVEPMRILSGVLPAGTRVAYTHPLFGPMSAPGALDGKLVAVCADERSGLDTARLVRFLTRLKLKVIRCSAEEHDRQMATVQGLTHFLAQSLRLMNLPDEGLATMAYQHLLALARNLTADSWPLFVTIAEHNPYAAEVRREFVAALGKVEERLRNGE